MTVTTRLSDVIVPAIYESYGAVDNIELTAFYNSGVIVRNPVLDSFAVEGGTEVTIPFWKDLDQTVEPNYSSDDPDVQVAAQKLAAGSQVARTANLNENWSAADLVSELAGSDPMKRIRARVDVWWARQWQRRLIAACVGVAAGNVANNAGDMVIDVSRVDGLNATDQNLFGRSQFTSAGFTLGDQFGQLQAIAVHSIVYKRMIDNDDIEFIRDSAGNMTIPTYMGMRVIYDDQMPVAAGGTNGFVYTSILFGNGAIGYGEGTPRVPSEVWRDPKGGNGGGIELFFTRKTWLIHPAGFKWLEASLSAQSPTLVDLRNSANWSRVVARKNIPLAFLKTNG